MLYPHVNYFVHLFHTDLSSTTYVPRAHILDGETDTEQIILRMTVVMCLVMIYPIVMQIKTESNQRLACPLIFGSWVTSRAS